MGQEHGSASRFMRSSFSLRISIDWETLLIGAAMALKWKRAMNTAVKVMVFMVTQFDSRTIVCGRERVFALGFRLEGSLYFSF